MRKELSPTRSQQPQQLSQRPAIGRIAHRQIGQSRRGPISKAADYNTYFCHFNNAVYMGGMSAYKKHGKGLLLHDDGSSVITEYLHDTPSGHNIIFRQNSITSVLYRTKDQFEVAYKQGKYIVIIPFGDSSFKAHGAGVLIDYAQLKVYRLVFKRGALVQKALHSSRRDNEDVFNRNRATSIIGNKHDQAFNLAFQTQSRVDIKHQANKYTIGYFDQDAQLHGLGFSFYGQDLTTNGSRSLYLKFIEKGYYRESQLETYGEKLFNNGNKYVGEFDKGEFHGFGILISPSQMRWVYGKFNRGKLGEIIDSNYKRNSRKQFEIWSQSLADIHRRYKQRWIDMSIDLPEESYLYKTLKAAVESAVTSVEPDPDYQISQEESRMSRIQQQFQKQQAGNSRNSNVQKQLNRHFALNSAVTTKKLTQKQEMPRPYTPVSKFQLATSRKNQTLQAQNYYREQDPFKLTLTKVPVDSQPLDHRESPIKESKKEQKSTLEKVTLKDSPPEKNQQKRPNLLGRPRDKVPLRQPISKGSNEKYLPYFYEPYDYGYRNTELLTDYIDSVYSLAYYEELRKQTDRLNRLEEDQLYKNRLRRGLETSPVHRSYYLTPPKSPNYHQSNLGRLTSKRNFNYDLDQGYRKQSQSPKGASKSGNNYMKNNYPYWNSKS